MSEQPPVQPPSTPPQQPASSPGSNPPTQPMTAAYSAPPAGPAGPSPAYPPRTSTWRQVTATPGRRWALALSAAAVVLLLAMGVALTSLLVLRNHDRFSLVGDRQPTRSFGQQGPGNGNGHGHGKSKGLRPDGGQNDRSMPGLPGGGAKGLGGLGNLLGGTSLHGQVTASAAGSVQTLLFQRGEVTALSATSVTLKSSDGFTDTYGLNASTRDRGASLAKGQQAFVLARASDKVAITTLSMSAQAPTN